MADTSILGAWKLQSFAFTDGAGAVEHPLGEEPTGFAIFSDGHMALNFMAAGRTPYADDNVLAGSADEKGEAAATYVSFGGPYRVDGNLVIVEVEQAFHPNWAGRTQVRQFEVSGDTLVLRTTGPIRIKGTARTGEARFSRA